jgi:enoyl-CoA hydratase/carnithine racemase
MIDRLIGAIHDAAADNTMRFVRIRARGPNFCLGREREGRAPDELRREAARIVRLNETLRSTPLVCVAEVQGDAAGFGAGLVAATDIAIAAQDAALSFPEILAGLAPTIVIGWLAFAMPHKRAFRMVSTGERMPAAEAVRWGLLSESLPPEQLADRVDEALDGLRDKHAEGLRDIKRFFAQARGLDPVTAATASVDPLVVASLRLGG